MNIYTINECTREIGYVESNGQAADFPSDNDSAHNLDLDLSFESNPVPNPTMKPSTKPTLDQFPGRNLWFPHLLH